MKKQQKRNIVPPWLARPLWRFVFTHRDTPRSFVVLARDWYEARDRFAVFLLRERDLPPFCWFHHYDGEA